MQIKSQSDNSRKMGVRNEYRDSVELINKDKSQLVLAQKYRQIYISEEISIFRPNRHLQHKPQIEYC